MNGHRRHLASGVAVIALAVTSLMLLASGSAGARGVSQSTAPCTAKARLSMHLTGSDIPFLRTYVPCVVQKLRPASTGKLVTSATLSRDALAFLNADAKGTQAQGLKKLETQQNSAGRAYCAGRAYRDDSQIGDSHPPPVLTPATVASAQAAIAKRFAIWRQPGTVFGFAYARHLIFNDRGVTNPVAYLVIAVRCS